MIFSYIHFLGFLIFSHVIVTYSKITILTYPVGIKSRDSWYHKGVTHSLLRGLKELNIDFNYNPIKLDAVESTVIVLTNIDALKQAIELKRVGRIKKILAGPNLVVLPREQNEILLSPEIDICIVPSEWVKNAYIEEAPCLAERIYVWPSGVDTDYWSPKTMLSQKKSHQVVVYWKTEPLEFCQQVEALLSRHHWNPIRITYGEYTQDNYKQTLQETMFAVFISRSESQGLALAEAWSMDVPTFVWDPQRLTIGDKVFSEVSACPYLNAKVGHTWETFDELEKLVRNFINDLIAYSPRSWTTENMSDVASAKILLSLTKD